MILPRWGDRSDADLETSLLVGAQNVNPPTCSDQELSNPLRFSNSRREPDALKLSPSQFQEPLQGYRYLDTALVGRQLMNLVDDHPSYGAKMFLHPLPDQYRLKSLRRRDQEVWRALGLLSPSTSW